MQGRRGGVNGGDLVVVEYSIPRSLTQQIAPHRRCTRLMIEKRLMNFRQVENGEAIYRNIRKKILQNEIL
ncbi:MAG: hypothetical protein GYA35_05170 [Thermoanaerobaculaceae bacterium]|nr:hypothetical protein [Thermoanaerobaculaceae bacterium]